jgi:methylenetetrahydrofolate--tRNA-(uracil-5-)-methyltransferase
MVGFQTNLRWGEQERVFRLIPGLERAEFVRFGQMHRNTFINAPTLLDATLQFKREPGIFFAGQITGSEGYVSAVAGGLLAGLNAARRSGGEELLTFPPTTMMGALFRYMSAAEPEEFQPMKANFGLLPPLERRVRGKKHRYQAYAERALEALEAYMGQAGLEGRSEGA